MVKGSCVCGQAAYDWTGEYDAFVACHCIPCRKSSGADRSLNLAIKSTSLKVTPGSPEKLHVRKGDSGKNLTYHQCGNCGSTLYAEPEVAPGVLYLKAGLIDDKDFMDKLGAPQMHIYCKNLWAWETTTPGAKVEQS